MAIELKLAESNPAVIEFQSDLAGSQNNIGVVQGRIGKPAEALTSHESALVIWRKLTEANPTVTEFQTGLGISQINISDLLDKMGKPAEALTSDESALAIRRKLAEANPTVTEFQNNLAASHNRIGVRMAETGKPAEALSAYESALAIRQKLARDHPESPDYASNLGGTLNNLAVIDLDAKRFPEACIRLREAIKWQRKAMDCNSLNPTYRQFLTNHLDNLIKAAQVLGDSEGLAEAVGELAELRDTDPTKLALDARLSAILRGDQQPRDNPERLRLAQRAYDKALHAAAAKFWAVALSTDPKLTEDRHAQTPYNAACAAALAGCGQGKDHPAPDVSEKAILRKQAHTWLQAELAAWTKLLESDRAEARQLIVQTLQHWQEDGDLAGVREPKAIEALPEAEREAWRALWAGVEGLLTRAQESSALSGEH